MHQHRYSEWRIVGHPLDASVSQPRAALMTHQDVADCDILTALLAKLTGDEWIYVIAGDGVYYTKLC